MSWNGKKFRVQAGVCKDCADREIGCHATCEKYITAKKEWEAEKNKIYAEKGKTVDYDAFRFETVSKRRFDRERKMRKLRR